MADAWTWEGEVEGRGVAVVVGEDRRVGVFATGGGAVGAPQSEEALTQALRAAVARMRALEEAGAEFVLEEAWRGERAR